MTRPRFKHEDFQFGYEIALGSVYRGYADAGEVDQTAGRIKDGDADAWVREWCATAEALETAAKTAADAGHRVSAHAAYLRAATYYSTGLYLITHASDPGRQHDIWLRHRACFDRSVDLAAVPGERLEIPYEGTTLPGYFFRAPDAAPGEARPLVVMQNGSDGATSGMATLGGIARERARLPLPGLRRPGPAGRAVPAEDPVSPRLGGGADARGRRDGSRAPTWTPTGSR